MIEKVNILDFKKEYNGLDVHNKLLINPKDKIEQQPIALSYGYKFDSHVPIISYGNFMCIVGASKSMKSFLKSAFIASYIGGKAQNHFPDALGHNTQGKFVIDLDTEQSEFHVHKVGNRVLSMVGNDNPYYKIFALRSIDPKERVQFLEWLYNESEYRGKIGLCSIDGVADLIDNVNDLDKSNEITQKLMKLTEEHNSAMITVLHRNFDSDKPTGHLGSAILKKAETVLFVDKNNDIVEVRPRYTRNIPFDAFSFYVDENGIPNENGKIF